METIWYVLSISLQVNGAKITFTDCLNTGSVFAGAINDGRDKERIERGMKATYSFYDGLDYPCVDTTYITPVQVADHIIKLIKTQEQ